MKWIPVDQGRVQFLGTGCAAEVYDWTDGKRSDHQAIDAGPDSFNTGLPLWVCDVLVVGGDRAQVAGMRVAAREKPVMPLNQPVHFERPEVSMYAQRKGREGMQVVETWRAVGIAGGFGQQKSGDKAA